MKNYRPISLLSVACKVFTKVIANRIRTTIDFNEPNDQAGLRKGYSTIDHIHTIIQAIEKCAEYNQPLYVAFIEYEKSFGSVKTSAARLAICNQGGDESYIRILQDIYSGYTVTIVLHKESNKILIKKVSGRDTRTLRCYSARIYRT